MLLQWNLSPTVQSFVGPQSPSSRSWTIRALAAERSKGVPRRSQSAIETRMSLVLALASQASFLSQRLLGDLVDETAKYVLPRRFEARTLDEALMFVPDLETVRYRVLKRTDQYEIREVEPYYVAETAMPGKTGFDFNKASLGFNVLAEYLFGKNTTNEQMEMTTPVITRKVQSDGEKMDMTTPVITKQSGDNWAMSFVMPSKYGANLPLPKDPSVRIKEVPQKIVAVVAFSGFVTDEDVKQRESKLRDALRRDSQLRVKQDAFVEVSQATSFDTMLRIPRWTISTAVQVLV